VRVGVCSCCRERGSLRIRRRHGHVRGRRLEGPQRRVRHAGAAIGRRGHRRLRGLRVAIVATVRQRCKRRAAVQRWQRGQLVLRTVVALLTYGRVLGQAGLAEAVSRIHYVRMEVGMLGGVLSRKARPIELVVGEFIRRTSSPGPGGGLLLACRGGAQAQAKQRRAGSACLRQKLCGSVGGRR
jgi:hypothetical protein